MANKVIGTGEVEIIFNYEKNMKKLFDDVKKQWANVGIDKQLENVANSIKKIELATKSETTAKNDNNKAKKEEANLNEKLINQRISLDKASKNANATQKEYINSLKQQLAEGKKLESWQKERVKLLGDENEQVKANTISYGFLSYEIARMGDVMFNAVKGAVTLQAELEKSIAITGAVAGANAQEVEMLGDAMIQMGTDVPIKFQKIGESMYDMASAGLNASEVLESMPKAIALSAGVGEDLNQTIELLVSTVKGFDLDFSEAPRILDVFANSVAKSMGTIEKLQVSFARVAPIAKQAGVSFEETTAILSKLYDLGLRGSNAGTVLANVMTKLSSFTDQATESLEKAGLKTSDVSLEYNSLGEALAKLNMKMKEGKIAGDELQKIFGMRGKIITDFMGQLEGNTIDEMTASYDRLVNSISDAEGATSKFLKAQEETTQMALDRFSNAIDRVKLLAGESIKEGLVPLANALANVLNGLVDIAEKNPAMSKFVGILVGLGGTVGFVASALGKVALPLMALKDIGWLKLATGVNTLGSSFTFLGVSSTALIPVIGGVVAVLGALAGALWIYNKRKDELAEKDKKINSSLETLKTLMESNNGVLTDNIALTNDQLEAKKKLEAFYGTEITNLGELAKAQEQYNKHLELTAIYEKANIAQKKLSTVSSAIQKTNSDLYGVYGIGGSTNVALSEAFDKQMEIAFQNVGLNYKNYQKDIKDKGLEAGLPKIRKLLSDNSVTLKNEIETLQSKANKIETGKGSTVKTFTGRTTKTGGGGTPDGKDPVTTITNEFPNYDSIINQGIALYIESRQKDIIDKYNKDVEALRKDKTKTTEQKQVEGSKLFEEYTKAMKDRESSIMLNELSFEKDVENFILKNEKLNKDLTTVKKVQTYDNKGKALNPTVTSTRNDTAIRETIKKSSREMVNDQLTLTTAKDLSSEVTAFLTGQKNRIEDFATSLKNAKASAEIIKSTDDPKLKNELKERFKLVVAELGLEPAQINKLLDDVDKFGVDYAFTQKDIFDTISSKSNETYDDIIKDIKSKDREISEKIAEMANKRKTTGLSPEEEKEFISLSKISNMLRDGLSDVLTTLTSIFTSQKESIEGLNQELKDQYQSYVQNRENALVDIKNNFDTIKSNLTNFMNAEGKTKTAYGYVLEQSLISLGVATQDVQTVIKEIVDGSTASLEKLAIDKLKNSGIDVGDVSSLSDIDFSKIRSQVTSQTGADPTQAQEDANAEIYKLIDILESLGVVTKKTGKTIKGTWDDVFSGLASLSSAIGDNFLGNTLSAVASIGQLGSAINSLSKMNSEDWGSLGGFAKGLGYATVAIGAFQAIKGLIDDDGVAEDNAKNVQLWEDTLTGMDEILDTLNSNFSSLISYTQELVKNTTPTTSNIAKGSSQIQSIADILASQNKNFSDITYASSHTGTRHGRKKTIQRTSSMDLQTLYAGLGFTGNVDTTASLEQLQAFADKLNSISLSEFNSMFQLDNEGLEDFDLQKANFKQLSAEVQAYVDMLAKAEEQAKQFARNSTLSDFEGLEVQDSDELFQSYIDQYEEMGITITDTIKEQLKEIAKKNSIQETISSSVRDGVVNGLVEGLSISETMQTSLTTLFSGIMTNVAKTIYDTVLDDFNNSISSFYLDYMNELEAIKSAGGDTQAFAQNYDYSTIMSAIQSASELQLSMEGISEALREQAESAGIDSELIDYMLSDTYRIELSSSIEDAVSSGIMDGFNNGDITVEDIKSSIFSTVVDSAMNDIISNVLDADEVKDSITALMDAIEDGDVSSLEELGNSLANNINSELSTSIDSIQTLMDLLEEMTGDNTEPIVFFDENDLDSIKQTVVDLENFKLTTDSLNSETQVNKRLTIEIIGGGLTAQELEAVATEVGKIAKVETISTSRYI